MIILSFALGLVSSYFWSLRQWTLLPLLTPFLLGVCFFGFGTYLLGEPTLDMFGLTAVLAICMASVAHFTNFRLSQVTTLQYLANLSILGAIIVYFFSDSLWMIGITGVCVCIAISLASVHSLSERAKYWYMLGFAAVALSLCSFLVSDLLSSFGDLFSSNTFQAAITAFILATTLFYYFSYIVLLVLSLMSKHGVRQSREQKHARRYLPERFFHKKPAVWQIVPILVAPGTIVIGMIAYGTSTLFAVSMVALVINYVSQIFMQNNSSS
ncbi:MAG: hypothetical protein WDZ93_00705 [Candidatus Paceibacterota bacterium]